MPAKKKSRIPSAQLAADFIAKTLVSRNESNDIDELSKTYVESFEKALDSINSLIDTTEN